MSTRRPYELTEEDQRIVDKLVAEFTSADHLRRHVDFLYRHGSMYLVRNRNLLFHGCVPLNEDGTFTSVNCLGTWRSGRDYLDFCDEIARRAWRMRDADAVLARNAGIVSETDRFDVAESRRMVGDTDTGVQIREQIRDLHQLLDAYRTGVLEERR